MRIARSVGASLIVALLAAACAGDPVATATPPALAATAATAATQPAPAGTPVATATATPTEQPDAAPNDAFSLEATDGNATLEIPAGALPPGVAASDVSITAIEGPSEERFAVYRLEPDGMVPLEPLILTVTVDLAEGEAVSVMVVDADGNPVDGAAEIVGLARAADDGPLDLLVEVNHFSAWIIGKVDEDLRVDIEPVDDQLVGTTFTVRARVVRNPLLRVKTAPSDGLQWTGTDDDLVAWYLSGSWRATGPVSPKEAANPGTGIGTGVSSFELYDAGKSAAVVEQQFTCDAKGDFAISFRANGQLLMILELQGSSENKLDYILVVNPAPVTWSAECVAPATPTPEVTAIAPPSSPTAVSIPGAGTTATATPTVAPPPSPSPTEPPGDATGTGSPSSVSVEGNGVTMTVSPLDEATAGQTYRVQITITGPVGAPLSGEVACTLARKGDPDARHDSVTLSSDGTAMLAIQIPDSWNTGDEVALFCFFEALSGEAQFITSFFLP